MNNDTLIPTLIAAIVLVAIGLVAVIAFRGWRSQKLRDKFGSEYDHIVDELGDLRAAEETLVQREKRVNRLDIHDLEEHRRQGYRREWLGIQAGFVDDPSGAIKEADRLVTEVMIARGFPVEDFEQRAADLSVLYPEVVSKYRKANAVADKNERNEASTEELRQAIVYYHILFDELLGSEETVEVEAEEKEPMPL